jgi:hypothetical protein
VTSVRPLSVRPVFMARRVIRLSVMVYTKLPSASEPTAAAWRPLDSVYDVFVARKMRVLTYHGEGREAQRLSALARLRHPAVSAPQSLLEGKQTLLNVDCKRPCIITKTLRDAGDLLKGETLSPLQGSRCDKSKFRAGRGSTLCILLQLGHYAIQQPSERSQGADR